MVWLRTSLFAKKCHWGNILQDGIKLFISDVSHAKWIKNLSIEFNYLSGENIRFAVQVEMQNAEILALKLDTFFKFYFKAVSFSKKELVLPLPGLFLPFPSNTIQYGLYIITNKDNELLTRLISITSFCLIAAFENCVIDEELLVTSAFYLHGTLFSYSEMLFEGNLNYLSFYDSEDSQSKKDVLDKSYLAEKYLENKQSLLEIKESLNNPNSLEFRASLPWLSEWLTAYETIVKERMSKEIEIYLSMSNCINAQLGLSDNMKLLVYYFVSCAFN